MDFIISMSLCSQAIYKGREINLAVLINIKNIFTLLCSVYLMVCFVVQECILFLRSFLTSLQLIGQDL